MTKLITFAIAVLFIGNTFAQQSFFSDDFESGSSSWTLSGDVSPNSWIFNTCAGNGTSLPGTTSMYITSGGSIPGCGATGTEQHAYVDAPSGTLQAISSASVDAGCLVVLTATFDYRIDGVLSEDYAEMVYSTNGGTTWTAVGSELTISPAWNTASIALPAILNATAFDIGIRFTYNDNTVNGAPIAIDNFDISGFDLNDPTITCPGTQSDYLDGTCQLSVADYTGLAITSDDCLSYGPVTVTQAPPSGSIIGATAAITLTATDAFGNTSNCAFTLQAIDTISPTVTCPPTSTVGTNSGCDFIMTDYTGSAVGNDNCTFGGSLIYTQNPIVGTNLPVGTHSITITVEDAGSNTGSCSFDLVVEDQTPPVISTCSPNQNVIVDVACSGTLGDYTSSLTVSDNCTSNGNLIFTQAPIAGTTITSNTLVTVTVEDENGNTTDCQFTAMLSDTISPVVTCPNDTALAINGNCEYTVPDFSGGVSGMDNCSVLANMGITQNPIAGSTQNGNTNVLIILTDEQGNTSTCITAITPIDTVAPAITCPADQDEHIGTNCDMSFLYYGGMSLVLDNCPNYAISQSPAMGTIVNAGSHVVTLTVTDAGGNTDQCTFNVNIIESIPPTITCPADISTCDPIVSFPGTIFSDNCLASMSQTDLTGLTSGSTFPIGITTLEFTAIDSSGNTAMCSFDIEVLEYPSSANIVDDTLFLCDENSAILMADTITSGTGLWTVSTGQGTFNNQFAATTGVNNIGNDTSIYAWTVSSPTCGSLSDSIVVINSQQDLQASTQDTIYSCGDPSVILQANTPLYGSGMWTTDGNGIIDDKFSSNTTSTLADNGWQNFIWTITNGGCPATSDTLHVYSTQNPVLAYETTEICIDQMGLVASGPAPAAGQTSYWSIISGQGDILQPDSLITLIENLGLGTTLVTYTYSNPYCPETSDTITVIGSVCDGFDPIIPTVITPGNLDGKNDVFTIDYLDPLYPECHVTIFNRWGSVVYESTGYSDPWDGTHKGENLPMGTYFYKIELNDPEGQVLVGEISIIH